MRLLYSIEWKEEDCHPDLLDVRRRATEQHGRGFPPLNWDSISPRRAGKLQDCRLEQPRPYNCGLTAYGHRRDGLSFVTVAPRSHPSSVNSRDSNSTHVQRMCDTCRRDGIVCPTRAFVRVHILVSSARILISSVFNPERTILSPSLNNTVCGTQKRLVQILECCFFGAPSHETKQGYQSFWVVRFISQHSSRTSPDLVLSDTKA